MEGRAPGLHSGPIPSARSCICARPRKGTPSRSRRNSRDRGRPRGDRRRIRFPRMDLARGLRVAAGRLRPFGGRRLAPGGRPDPRVAAQRRVREPAPRGFVGGQPRLAGRRFGPCARYCSAHRARRPGAPPHVPAVEHSEIRSEGLARAGRQWRTSRGGRSAGRRSAAGLAFRWRRRQPERPGQGLRSGAALRARVAEHRRHQRRSALRGASRGVRSQHRSGPRSSAHPRHGDDSAHGGRRGRRWTSKARSPAAPSRRRTSCATVPSLHDSEKCWTRWKRGGRRGSH